MRLKPTLLIAGGLVAVTVALGCVGRYKSDFPVVVVNRTANTIQVLVNGGGIGQVTAGQTGSFSIQLTETNPNEFTNGVAPTPQAQVTFSAKDLKTGGLSTTKSMTLSQSSPTYVTFSAADFPASVPTVARFTNSPTAPGVNEDVSFSAASSSVSGGTFTWDFGDQTTGAGVTVIHQYSRASTFTVTLAVTSDSGQTATASRTVTVSAALPPTAAAFTFSPATPGVNQNVIFTASTPTATGLIFTWNFGDGGTGSGVSVTHQYARAGTYTVTLQANNGVGQSASSSRTVTASGTSPQVVASFTFSPTLPGINQNVFFNATASTPSNGTFAWNFGDGSRGSGVTPTHQYSLGATYTVTLTVTNDIGQSSTTSRTITVSATSAQVVASFTFSPTGPGVNQDVFFNASASTPSSGTFVWDFGDGSRGSGITPTHQYSQGATYTVTLTVTNSNGQSATTSRTVPVTAATIVASFTVSPTDPSISLGTNTVIFDATGSSSGVTAWTWDFGDGTAAGAGQKTSHTFSKAGTWIVRLTVTDSAGRTATTTNSVTVK